MAQENIFADGMMFRKPREGAPDFVKGSISIKVAEFIPFLKQHDNNGWVNIDLKKSKGGKLYLSLNTYRKDKGGKAKSEDDDEALNRDLQAHRQSDREEQQDNDDIPF